MKNALLKRNDEIAHYVTKDAYIHLVSQREIKKVADDNLTSLNKQITELEKQKLDFDAQCKNFQIAVDDINRSLAYIFLVQNDLILSLALTRCII